MNAKVLFKTVFALLVLLLLVLMGMSNQENVHFALRWLLEKGVHLPAAVMYFAFFAVGVLTATVLGAGAKKASSSGSRDSKK